MMQAHCEEAIQLITTNAVTLSPTSSALQVSRLASTSHIAPTSFGLVTNHPTGGLVYRGLFDKNGSK